MSKSSKNIKLKITQKLFEYEDKQYAAFQSKLTPTIAPDKFIGVRVPTLRKIAKEYMKDEEFPIFLSTLPHQYYDENMLHSMLLSEIKDYDTCVSCLKEFLPYIDNWAVNDTISPKCFTKNKDKLIKEIKKWTKSSETYTIRYGLLALMKYYLDEDFNKEYLEMPASIVSEEYYVRMMIAWLFATALAKQWDDTIPYLQKYRLDPWTHNKTIQKAIESYRITAEQKEYLRTLRFKS